MTFKGEGRPAAYTAGGKRVTGVTTILGQFTEPGGLVHWAFKNGQAHPDWTTPYQKSDDAKDAGTVAHAMVEAWIHGNDPNDELKLLDNQRDVQQNAARAFENFLEWFRSSGIEIVATEVPLASETHGFGGTIDAVGVDAQGRVCILDWKTSNSIYTDHVIQVAAYGQLWEDTHPGVSIDGGYHILQFHKEHAQFAHKWWENLQEARDLFLHLVAAHAIKKELKKRV